MHGRANAYLSGSDHARAAVVDACRREATVPDLAERILGRTIYTQSASRTAPLRELLQNAIDASPRGGRVDVRSSEDGSVVAITDRGRGMTRAELLGDLLVPFRSAKAGDLETIGEHGIGFFSALEIAPRLDVTTSTGSDAHRLTIEPVGDGPPHADFAWTLTSLGGSRRGPTGTAVRLVLERPLARGALAAEVASVAGLVDPEVLRIYVDDALVNAARGRLRHVARVPIAGVPEVLGELDLFVGRGDGIEPVVTMVQGGLLVSVRQEPFLGPELALHRDLVRAITSSGAGLVVELPLGVPLNKGRSGVAASAARAVDQALVTAFERFILEDALFQRELLRGVDHRLGAVLDRLVHGALAGEPPPELTQTPAVDELAPTLRDDDAPPESGPRPLPMPTVAAPEEVVHFAAALVEARLFQVSAFDASLGEMHQRASLREVLSALRARVLRRLGDPVAPGYVYLDTSDPLSDALSRRLATLAPPPPPSVPGSIEEAPPTPHRMPMQRVSRTTLLTDAAGVPGIATLAAAITVLERVDGAISLAAGLAPSPISVHQDLYGPDEMAHTDGTGISVNFASPRVRALLGAVIGGEDATAFAALVDLLLHEKTHVSLATYVPRPAAEHGASFYRRKDLLRRRLLEGIANGGVVDPIRWLPSIRRPLVSVALPDPIDVATAFMPPSVAA
jgi:hypothetical protein